MSFGKTVYNADYHHVPLGKRLNDLYGGAEGDRWALVTGASEGIGRSYALQLAQAGYNLKICARSVDKLEKVAEEAKAINPKCQTKVIRLDVSSASPADYANLFSKEELTSIVVNNAGIMKNKMFLETDPALLEMQIETNVHPYIYMTKYAVRHFIEAKE